MIKRFISYYKPYKTLFILDLVAATILAACDLVYPILTRELVNDIIPNKLFAKIVNMGIILLVIYIVKMGCNYFMNYYGHVVGVKMQSDMRKEVYKHLQNLPIKYFDNHQTGSIMSRIVNDLQEISELAHHGPEDIFISIIMLIGSFFMLLSINVQLTLIIFAVMPLLIWFAIINRQKMLDAFMKRRETTGAINANLSNSISGIRVSKAFVNRESEYEKFKVSNKSFQDASTKAYKVMAEYVSGVSFLVDILDFIVLIAGALFTYNNKIDFGDYLAYLLYTRIFTQPIKKLIGFVEQYQYGMTGFKRFVEIVDEDVEKDHGATKELNVTSGKIEFCNVSFSHDEKSVLRDISFVIESGKMVALVGPSGGGKTTLCNLIPRFYNVNSGSILIDGVDTKDIFLDSLRKNIGIVQQEVFLFSGTIGENIRIGKPDASDSEIVDAAIKANLHEFISTLPDGYNTEVGERGIKLSGGQKQRVSIARIFLKNPPILILDEATSALDNITEQLIQNSLNELCRGRTTIVVAHRLSTVRNADEIIVLTDNGIEERGSHSQLIEKNGLYKELYLATTMI